MAGSKQRLALAGRTGRRTAGKRRTDPGGKRGGMRALHEAADKVVEEHKERIADTLLQGALRGDVTCAKLLFTLAESLPEADGTAKKRCCPRIALALAKEPQWKEEASETFGKTDGGSLDAEG
jgi:hypothetical protein